MWSTWVRALRLVAMAMAARRLQLQCNKFTAFEVLHICTILQSELPDLFTKNTGYNHFSTRDVKGYRNQKDLCRISALSKRSFSISECLGNEAGTTKATKSLSSARLSHVGLPEAAGLQV